MSDDYVRQLLEVQDAYQNAAEMLARVAAERDRLEAERDEARAEAARLRRLARDVAGLKDPYQEIP